MRMEFNPSQITPVPDLGSFYGRLNVRDAWGELRTEGALISTDFQRVVAASPDVTGLAGPGWSLTLNPGYRVLPTSAPGVLTIVAVTGADQSP
jgi:hypothetical protein